jgi:hypothetical protein
VAAAGGCATIPSSGPVRSLRQPQNGTLQGQDFPQLIPAPPGKGWTPVQVVSGFLAANASFAGNNAAAREYLTPGQARTWNPGSAVTVVSQPNLTRSVVLNRLTGQSGANIQFVHVSGQELATLTASGQYQIPQASTKQAISFPLKLMKIRGQWRIVNPPKQLLLSKSDFLRVYQPRNLYFLIPGSKPPAPGNPLGETLVPDPVYVPLQATASDLAADLVNALQQRPLGSLSGVTQTAFPPGTKVIGVRIEGPAAIVNLGGTVSRASATVLDNIAAQLVWTLTSSSYGRQAINSVKLEVDGVPQRLPGAVGGFALPSEFAGMVPEPVADGGLYFVGEGGAVQVLHASHAAAPPRPVLGQAGTGLAPMTSIAVSPSTGQRSIAGISPGAGQRSIAGISPDGRAVYFGALTKGGKLASWRPGGKITSLSWDVSGDLWVAAGNGVWLRRPGRKAPVAVDTGQLAPGDRVTALRVAPDGVRIAMIVRGKTGSQLDIAAVRLGANTASIGQLTPIGAGISDPAELSWYNPDNLIVLFRPASASPVLAEVPLSGGTPTPIGAEPHTRTIATAGSQIVAGLRGNRLVTLSGPDGSWQLLGPGQDPAYPG